ncbi:MAG: HAD-IIIA family hydrolase [Clostridia bacterium]|nr:HAD-IIIA family hydrolase [Clostridia bacterium]
MFKAVIFDLDGTLVNTLDDLAFAMNEMLGHFGYPERSKNEIETFIGNGQRMFVKRSLPEHARDEENIDLCTKYYAEKYSENIVRFSRAYEGIPEALENMKKAGMKIAVLSNKSDIHVQKIINELFGNDFFDLVLGAGRFAIKPDPEAVLYIAENLGADPCECAFVGDSDVDIKTAHSAGMTAVWVSWGFQKREILKTAGECKVADSAEDLQKILVE